MKNKFLYLSVILILQLIGCQQPSALKITAIEANSNLVISMSNPNLKNPFKLVPITDRNQGPIYFETPDDTFYINTKPLNEEFTNNTYTANWKINERELFLIINQGTEETEISLSAVPDEDILKWGVNIAAGQDEFFTGLFERVVDGGQQESWKVGITEAMDLRGQAVEMIIWPTLSLYSPFYLSSNGYGLFTRGTWPGHYDFCKDVEGIVQVAFEGPSLDMLLYSSENPMDIVQKHSLETGPSHVPPKWAFGFIRWRDDHDNNPRYYDSTLVKAPYNSMLVEDILMMEALQIPSTAYWVDRPWAIGSQGYDDFEFDRNRFPDPEGMINWLKKKDIRFLLWISPWVMGDMARVAFEKGYSMKSKEDNPDRALIDFYNPEAVKWWQEEGLAKVLKMGVKGFKMDRSEELVPETRDIKVYDGRTTREIRNDYPVQYVKATNEISKKIHGDDFLLFPRAGYTGSSKYSAFWGGDIGSPQEGLRAAIIAMQRASVIGYPVWGSDIGGYWQGEMDREVTARWLAFGCFSPIMELGPTENKGLWDLKTEPKYDPVILAIWRMYTVLHMNLIDYSYKYAREASTAGTPIVRPLFLQYPEEEKSWATWQAYLYGPDILVFPIWEKSQNSMNCYLPGKDSWIDAWDGKEYKGGEEVNINTPLHKIPIFIKKGSDVNLGDLNKLYDESLEIVQNKPDIGLLQEKEDFK